MNYLDVLGNLAPGVVLSAAKGVRNYLQPESYLSSKSTNQTNEVWVDPICAMITLAIFQKEPGGTKLSFADNEITFDQPLPFHAQSCVRVHKKSSRKDLYNLTPAIYYSIKWLNIAENEKYKIILEMAKKTISHMISYTYSDDLQCQQYLTTTHLRMLNEGLANREISREDFMIPNHDENPLNICSRSYWTRDVLDRVSKQLLEFKAEERGGVIKSHLIKKIKEINDRHKEYLVSVRAGRSTSVEHDDKADQIILVELSSQEEEKGDESLSDDGLIAEKGNSSDDLQGEITQSLTKPSSDDEIEDDFS